MRRAFAYAVGIAGTNYNRNSYPHRDRVFHAMAELDSRMRAQS